MRIKKKDRKWIRMRRKKVMVTERTTRCRSRGIEREGGRGRGMWNGWNVY